MSQAVLGLGANLFDRMDAITSAVESLRLLPSTKSVRCSGIYQTSPVGFQNQPDFLNCAVLIETGLSPHALLGACLGIEAAMGRVRLQKNGPRRIDLDLLLYEDFTCKSEELVLPHPRIAERLFVLVPLKELFPDGNALGYRFEIPENHKDTVEFYGRIQK